MVWTGIIAMMASRPDSGDAWCVAGAGLAAICALIEARGKGRTTAQTISVFIISSVVGSVGPGIFYSFLRWRGWIAPDSDQFILWQSWAGAGFFFGLNAWWVTHLVNRRIRRKIEAKFDRFFPDDEPETDTKSLH